MSRLPDQLSTDVNSQFYSAKRKVELFARSLPQFDSVIGAFPGWTFDLYKQPTLPEFLGGFPLLPDNEGYITFRSPPIKGEGKMQTLSIDDDFGEMVHGMLLDPARWNHQTIQCLSDAFTYPELMEHFTEGEGTLTKFLIDVTLTRTVRSSDRKEGSLYPRGLLRQSPHVWKPFPD